MILGTCNFNKEYNGSILDNNQIDDILKCYYELSDVRILDTATNYGCSYLDNLKLLLDKNNDRFKLIIKIWNEKDLQNVLDLVKDNIYCIMLRDTLNKDLLNKVYKLKYENKLEKVGISVYYPHELIQNCNMISIPATSLFEPYLLNMMLYSNVCVRSIFRLKYLDLLRSIKFYNKYTIKNNINKEYGIFGVDNIDQVKENIQYMKDIDNYIEGYIENKIEKKDYNEEIQNKTIN